MDSTASSRLPAVDLNLIKEHIAYKRSVFDWCLRNAHRCVEKNRLNEALAWNENAALLFSTSCVPLLSPELETNLLEIARRIPVPERKRTPNPGEPKRWLHVIDSLSVNGGHTSMAARWISFDPGNHIHNLAVAHPEETPLPEKVVGVSRRTGGQLFRPDRGLSTLARAEWLRRLAFAEADYVVAHLAAYNVIVPTAFGVDGGPPLLLINQAAHGFWTGAPAIDLVLNVRGSELEKKWTRELRGIPRCATLPIPIENKFAEGETFSPEFRAHARKQLGVADDEVLLLSIGRDNKYNALPGLDFVEVARSIFASCPEARMFVVGVTPEHWKRAKEATQGRLMPIGRQPDLSLYHAAADVYLEGFPFGSTTALLEVGALGIPCVLAPANSPPPFATDGVAIDEELRRPANVAEYVAAIRDLTRDPEERRRLGKSLQRSVLAHHCGASWHQYLTDLIRDLPERHAVYPVPQPVSPPEEIVQFWETYMICSEMNELPRIFRSAVFGGLRPRLDSQLYRAYRNARGLRHREGRLKLAAMAALSALLPFSPTSMQLGLYDRIVAMTGENGSISKAMSLLRNMKRRAPSVPAPPAQYEKCPPAV